MQEVIEIALETADGIADCRLELTDEDSGIYNVTILYPNIVNGFSRSEIYSHDMVIENGSWYFEAVEDIHPKIKKLEQQIAEQILKANS